jgi:hypothetical protein
VEPAGLAPATSLQTLRLGRRPIRTRLILVCSRILGLWGRGAIEGLEDTESSMRYSLALLRHSVNKQAGGAFAKKRPHYWALLSSWG